MNTYSHNNIYSFKLSVMSYETINSLIPLGKFGKIWENLGENFQKFPFIHHEVDEQM